MGNYLSSSQQQHFPVNADALKQEYEEGYNRLEKHYKDKHNYDLFEQYYQYSENEIIMEIKNGGCSP